MSSSKPLMINHLIIKISLTHTHMHTRAHTHGESVACAVCPMDILSIGPGQVSVRKEMHIITSKHSVCDYKPHVIQKIPMLTDQ